LNRFSVRFGSKTKKNIKSVWLFILVQNRTGPKMLSPTRVLKIACILLSMFGIVVTQTGVLKIACVLPSVCECVCDCGSFCDCGLKEIVL